MKDLDSNHKFIFIGGLHRSGKSLLYNCLKEHPLISGFRDNAVYQDEGQHAQSVCRPANDHGGQGRFGFNPEAHLTEESSLVTDENRIKLFSEWQRYWDLGKPYLLEQSPPNLIRTRFLQEMFPDSYFIIIIRHPLPVAYETRKCRGDRRITMNSLLKHWLVSHEVLEGDKEYIRKLFVVRYEDFVKNHHKSLDEIYSFLGLDSHDAEGIIRPDSNNEYFDKWSNKRSNMFMKGYIGFLRKKYENRLNKFGYSLFNLESQHE